MSDVKSVQPARALLPAGVPASGPAPVARKSDADDKSDSTDVVPSSSSSPPTLESIRKTLVAELLSGNSGVEINRFYDGTFSGWTTADVTTTSGSAVALNSVVQGTGYSQRLGDSIRCRRLRFRIHVRPAILTEPGGTTTGLPADIEYSYAYRVVIGIDRMPVIGAAIYADASSWNTGTTPPFSTQATHAAPKASFVAGTTVFPGMMHLAVRNPQTLSRYRLLYDVVHNPSSRYNESVYSAASGIQFHRASSEWLNLEFDLKDLVTQWYDQTSSTAIFRNRLFFFVVADAPNANPINYKWASELEFENVP